MQANLHIIPNHHPGRFAALSHALPLAGSHHDTFWKFCTSYLACIAQLNDKARNEDSHYQIKHCIQASETQSGFSMPFNLKHPAILLSCIGQDEFSSRLFMSLDVVVNTSILMAGGRELLLSEFFQGVESCILLGLRSQRRIPNESKRPIYVASTAI